MSPLVRIKAVGALVLVEGSDRARPVAYGAQINLSEKDAQRLVASGTAELVGPQDVAPNAEAENPDGGAIDLDALTVPELRKFADARRIELRDGRTRALIMEDIEAALTDPESEDGGGDG